MESAVNKDGVEKRTRRRVGNKSIIQSAIARKERSLRLDDRPRRRPSKTGESKSPQKRAVTVTVHF